MLLVVAIATGLPQAHSLRGLLHTAAGSFFFGTLIFSGCLALLALSGLKWLGAIVPIGGVLLLIGWALLAAVGFQLSAAGPPAE